MSQIGFLNINLPLKSEHFYTGHCTRSPRCAQWRGSTVYRAQHQVPKVCTMEGFHCIQDIAPGPQGVHNGGAPLYTGHCTRSPRCAQWRGSTVYRVLHQVPKVCTMEGFHYKAGRKGSLNITSKLGVQRSSKVPTDRRGSSIEKYGSA